MRRSAHAASSRCIDLRIDAPRLLVAGLRGGSGKTLLSLGLAASFRSGGLDVAPFKKGPDYIDASWLTRASGRPCRNLDLFLFSPPIALGSFARGAANADLALIEGNRGLFDGMDAEGTYSSAELAKLLRAPVLLTVDVTKTTRTAAAVILGCQTMDPHIPLAGVVLNRVAGSRHESVVRQAIEGICGLPVLGALPKLPDDLFPERHLGLIPPQETQEVQDPLARVADMAARYLDLAGILDVARRAPDLEVPQDGPRVQVEERNEPESDRPPPRIGVFVDEAFQFYYPENLEALSGAGGEIVEISPLSDRHLPPVDALYLGGGFPETLAAGLSGNRPFLDSVRRLAGEGLPIYAECGGAVYLGRTLEYAGESFGMAGVLPVDYGFQARPRGHGYTVLETIGENPFFEVGETLRGHEFHYTYLLHSDGQEASVRTFAFRVHRGYGFDGRSDGLVHGNVLASYTHIHALGVEAWAPSLVRAGIRFNASVQEKTAP
ncbi:MAG: cobyrinate a,c-diamide synthase [Longimicrobiales bacterium]